MVTAEQIKEWIERGLADSRVVYSEGDGQHFEAVVLCDTFTGKNMLMRHRMVYEALGHRMQTDIHALSLKTFTPAEYESRGEV